MPDDSEDEEEDEVCPWRRVEDNIAAQGGVEGGCKVCEIDDLDGSDYDGTLVTTTTVNKSKTHRLPILLAPPGESNQHLSRNQRDGVLEMLPTPYLSSGTRVSFVRFI